MTAIREVRIESLAVPFREPFASGTHRWEERRLHIVRLVGDDGEEGLGEIAAEGPGGLDDRIPSRLAGDLVGLDVADGDALDARLSSIDTWPRVGRAVSSAIASAAWDLQARRDGRSVAASIAPRPRNHVALNGLVGIGAPARAAAQAAALVAAGFGCLKLKGGVEPAGELVERVGAVRGEVGAEVALRLDLNGALDATSARELLASLAPFALEYVEQPLPPGDGLAALAVLRRQVPVPIAADEALLDLVSARSLVDAEAVDVFVVKLARVGGLPRAQEIVELAAEAGIAVVLSTLFETGVGIAAALQLAATLPGPRRAHGLATADLLASDLLLRPLHVRSGQMLLPAGTGLGVELDDGAAERFRSV